MKYALAILAALAAPAAAAPAGDRLAAMLASREAVLAALAPTVTLGPIAWTDAACARRFAAAAAVEITVTGEDREALAGCIAGLGLTRARIETGSPLAAIGKAGAVVSIRLARGKIAALDAAAPDAGDPRFPTVLRLWVNRDWAPTAATRAAVARTRARLATATFKLCHDAEGAITSRRIVRSSGVSGFDAEATAYFAALDQLEPYQPGGTRAPACSIVAVRYPDVLGGQPISP